MTCAPIRIGLFKESTSMRIADSLSAYSIPSFTQFFTNRLVRGRDANHNQSEGHTIP